MTRNYFNNKSDVWENLFMEKDNLKISQIIDKMEIGNNYAILDIGTGTGVLFPFLLPKIISGGSIVAIDIAEKMLTISQNKNIDKSTISLIQADILWAPFISDCFDMVICYSVFPHFRDKQKALHDINRVLKQRGFLYICHTSSRAMINRIHGNITEVNNDLIPDSYQMEYLLNGARFSDIVVEDGPDSYFVSGRRV